MPRLDLYYPYNPSFVIVPEWCVYVTTSACIRLVNLYVSRNIVLFLDVKAAPTFSLT